MERCNTGSIRRNSGGIISLREFIDKHREAINRDLISSAGIEIDDVGGSLSWGAFGAFIKRSAPDSALFRELHPEYGDWGTTFRTNVILADIYDCLAQMNVNMISGFNRKKGRQADKYPRPWAKKKEKKIGKAMKRQDLHKWIEKKRREARERWQAKSQEPTS